MTNFTDSKKNAVTYAIKVVSSGLILSSYERNTSKIIKYNKNGIALNLTNASHEALVNSIFFNNKLKL